MVEVYLWRKLGTYTEGFTLADLLAHSALWLLQHGCCGQLLAFR